MDCFSKTCKITKKFTKQKKITLLENHIILYNKNNKTGENKSMKIDNVSTKSPIEIIFGTEQEADQWIKKYLNKTNPKLSKKKAKKCSKIILEQLDLDFRKHYHQSQLPKCFICNNKLKKEEEMHIQVIWVDPPIFKRFALISLICPKCMKTFDNLELKTLQLWKNMEKEYDKEMAQPKRFEAIIFFITNTIPLKIADFILWILRREKIN